MDPSQNPTVFHATTIVSVRRGGQVVIAGFNPFSLFGAKRYFGREQAPPWNGSFIALYRLKDWLALLGFEVTGGGLDCYVPPCRSSAWRARCSFFESAGDRWWPIQGGVYFLQAVKRVRGLRLIMPKWSDRLAPKKALVPAPKKVRQPEDTVVAREKVTQ